VGEVAKQAEIAWREGVIGRWVTQILALNKLAPEVRQRILAELGASKLTDRRLRSSITKRDGTEQAKAGNLVNTSGSTRYLVLLAHTCLQSLKRKVTWRASIPGQPGLLRRGLRACLSGRCSDAAVQPHGVVVLVQRATAPAPVPGKVVKRSALRPEGSCHPRRSQFLAKLKRLPRGPPSSAIRRCRQSSSSRWWRQRRVAVEPRREVR